jgi:hypothetical protein
MAKKPRTPLEVMREMQRIHQASPLLRFLNTPLPAADLPTEPAAAESAAAESAAAGSPTELPAAEPPVRRQTWQRGQRPVLAREPLWRLNEEHPEWPSKQLARAYEDETKVKVSPDWVRKNRKRRPPCG